MSLFDLSVTIPEPRIVSLQEPRLVAGLSRITDTRTVYRDIPALGKKLKKLKKRVPVPVLKEPWEFVVVSRDFNAGDMSWTLIMGDVVTGFDGVPGDYDTSEIPAITYAVFTVRPKLSFLWSIAIVKVKKYFHTQWLPESGYARAGTIDDFELHDQASTRKKDPYIDLYFGIKANDQNGVER